MPEHACTRTCQLLFHGRPSTSDLVLTPRCGSWGDSAKAGGCRGQAVPSLHPTRRGDRPAGLSDRRRCPPSPGPGEGHVLKDFVLPTVVTGSRGRVRGCGHAIFRAFLNTRFWEVSATWGSTA